MSDDLSIGEFLDGFALWQEHSPQTVEDWVAVAERFVAAGDGTESSSRDFRLLVQAVKARDDMQALAEDHAAAIVARLDAAEDQPKEEAAADTATSNAEQSQSPAKGMESSSEWQHTPS